MSEDITIWVVTRTDYEDCRDEDGSKEIVGHFSTEAEAEEAAEEIFEQEAFEGVERDGDCLRNWQGDMTLQVEVDSVVVTRKKRKATPQRIANKYGPTMSIPLGTFGSLKRAKCMHVGPVEREVTWN